ncbi:TonB-dependent receptor [Marinihelvus fidelis]|uniref:TonB-dependent receptor n=1 Tax=Marinihelvus fidelis TaxID=2613842 RepID=A0A5N0T6Y6_9GAMM|nr:TonB-dependent receptor [Marinihelvus fidelis]KAA9129576.1 TonB-dependent receptor [Marinihelvus fidelis]
MTGTIASTALADDTERCQPSAKTEGGTDIECLALEHITILGDAGDVNDVAGGASKVSHEDLERFQATDVVRAMRQVPGVSFQVEDGYGLHPNISIRGTAAERSSRVTLLEDGILVAPAPYTAPSAYYFPTFGRIHAIEVLKGPAAITQGPYTVGGAINLVSTPIPAQASGHLLGEFGSDDTWRLHGWYGGGADDGFGWLVETHQWQSDGYQHIDRSDSDTGLDKSDYLAKGRYTLDTGDGVTHVFDIKLQTSEEQSRQSYLGLTDTDFHADALRRYGVSSQDEMDNEHQQVVLGWRMVFESGAELSIAAYDNEFERAWYKTEAIDFDGSADAQSFSGTGWANVINGINTGTGTGGYDAGFLQAIVDGADTPEGSIQVRNNSREYYARGIQLIGQLPLESGDVLHGLQAGLRFHRDEEDRLQRNDTWRQLNGQMVISDVGLQGNAGNRVQDAEAWATWIQDRIEWNDWTFTPGLRYENIELSRHNYGTSGPDPSSRNDDNLSSYRENHVDVWIPGIGVMRDLDNGLQLLAGVHKGFAVPGNSPGTDPEESINYELGMRWAGQAWQLDVTGFFNDYENLVGTCTNSSGSNCEPGDAFNGEGVHIPGLEVSASAFPVLGNVTVPLQLTYTWMDAEFQTSFDSEFFGDVEAGDPVPYVPDHELYASAGMEWQRLSAYLGASYVDSVCTQAACGAFQETDAATLFDLSAHYRLGDQWTAYVIAENVTDEIYIAGREPYGARPNKPRSVYAGVTFDF